MNFEIYQHNPWYCLPSNDLVEFAPSIPGSAPQPKPRSKGKKATFESHVTDSWEKTSPYAGQRLREEESAPDIVCEKKATFKSHIPEGTLIDFS